MTQHRSRGLLDRVVPKILATGRVDMAGLLEAVSVPRNESYYGFRTNVKVILEQKAEHLAAEADRRARAFQALAGLVVVVATLVAGSVVRSIARPLRELTRQAREMADRQLPEAVQDVLAQPLGDDVVMPALEAFGPRPRTRDEVADVAEALTTVQASALDLAVGQAVWRRNVADSLLNLGRRNQSLLDRQLAFITELESTTTDPDTLADLFCLDHLATRMRRYAESLLVLAGTAPPRRWAGPLRVANVIRAAVGEVEDYQRVVVDEVEPATVVEEAAADLTHLLAELVENALVYSPPDQIVEVRGRTTTLGTLAHGYTLAVVDAGLGMRPDELALANRRLAGGESFTVSPSKYLGHYVAGHLAARHGIAVTLHARRAAGAAGGQGITAVIELPPALVTDHPSASARPASAVPAPAGFPQRRRPVLTRAPAASSFDDAAEEDR
jgi:signal transduction histidine kinase